MDTESEEELFNCDDEPINTVENELCASLLLTNARSLLPKIGAMVDAFSSLELHCACITETWFKPGKDLKHKLDDIEGEHGIKVLHRSRDRRAKRSGGGVAVAFRTKDCNLKWREMKSRKEGQEIMCVVGKVARVPRKVAIIVVYIQPDMKAAKFTELCDTLASEIAAIKISLGNPVIYVAGDFNHRDVGPTLSLAGDLKLVKSGPTRGSNTLDRIYSNVTDRTVEKSVLPPLDAEHGGVSDHSCVFVKDRFPKARDFTWVAKVRRTRTRATEDAFAKDLRDWDWTDLSGAPTVDGMTAALEGAISTLTERHFPLVRVRRRSNEDPWINRSIRRLWKKKVRIYKKFGKSQSWWEVDARLQREIAKAKELFVEKLLDDGNRGRPFYAATRRLAAASTPNPWKVTDLYIGMRPAEVCSEVLAYFGRIANEGEGRRVPEIDRCDGGLGQFSVERTSELLRQSKKTDSVVDGDPLPHLIRGYPLEFAVPVAKIYNRINSTGCWPTRWKTEHLTIIPKNANPADLSECRNISCTSAFSKILEGQVLLKLRGELIPDPMQYGGIPKCGVEHMLLDLWEDVLSGMEGGDKAAIMLGIDYEKTFNRMDHGVCLEELQRLGASAGSLALVQAFLEDRTMTINIDGHAATPVPIRGGSPQGSVLGCLLYCITTQRLTKNLRGADDGGPGVFMYVDDTTMIDVVGTDNATLHISTSVTKACFEDLMLERDMRALKDRAENIHMKINAKKTQLLVLAPTNGCETSATINIEGHRVESVETLKLVGFTFGSRAGAAAHVGAVTEKIRKKMWMLYKLREAGFKGQHLFKLYCVYLRSIVEYCSVVYHSMLTGGQSQELERIQRLAVRICYGGQEDTDALVQTHCIQTLAERRGRRCDKFLRKAFQHPRFSERWFPQRGPQHMELRRRRWTEESRASTNRRFNSPLAYLRRRANELGLRRHGE